MLHLYLILIPAYLCSTTNGFDSNTFGGVSDMPNFKAQFGTNIASNTGFLAALYVVGEIPKFYHYIVVKKSLAGNVIGSFVAGPCADRWGRKWGMFIASLVTLGGAIAQASAQHRRDLIAGRILLGVGTVMLGPSAQSYTVGKLNLTTLEYVD